MSGTRRAFPSDNSATCRAGVSQQNPIRGLGAGVFENHLFVERLDHENRSHGISNLQKAAEEGFSNLVLIA